MMNPARMHPALGRLNRFLPIMSILLIAIVALVFSACGNRQASLMDTVKARGKLIAGVKYDSKPFAYLNANGKLEGYDVALMRELARRILGSPEAIEFQQVLSSTRVIALNSGSVDVVAATMTITPEREKLIDFSTPYFTAHQAIMVPENSAVQTLNDLKHRTILFIIGTTSEQNIKKRLPEAQYLGFKTSTDAFSALKAGRGDAMTSDDTILSGFLSGNCGFRMLKDRLSDEPYGLGLRQDERNESTTDMRNLINQQLALMARDGTLKRLRTQWVDTTPHSPPCRK